MPTEFPTETRLFPPRTTCRSGTNGSGFRDPTPRTERDTSEFTQNIDPRRGHRDRRPGRILTLNYVRGVENENAEKNQLVEVLVATGPIPKGSSADEAIATKLVAMDERRRADLPSAVVRRNAEIAGQVAAVDLTGGEIITSNMFVNQTDVSGTKSTSLDKGNVAITISVDESAGVAGLIQPGDSINILTTATVGAGGGEGEGGGGLTSGSGGYTLSSRRTTPSRTSRSSPSARASASRSPQPRARPRRPRPPERRPDHRAAPAEQARCWRASAARRLYLTLNRPTTSRSPFPSSPRSRRFRVSRACPPYGQDSDETGQ